MNTYNVKNNIGTHNKRVKINGIVCIIISNIGATTNQEICFYVHNQKKHKPLMVAYILKIQYNQYMLYSVHLCKHRNTKNINKRRYIENSVCKNNILLAIFASLLYDSL